MKEISRVKRYCIIPQDRSEKGDLQADWKGLVNDDCPDTKDSATLASKLCRPGFAYLETPITFLPIYHKVEHNCQMIQLPDTYYSHRLAFLHARIAQHRRLIDT